MGNGKYTLSQVFYYTGNLGKTSAEAN